jgi:hypothetical protein
LRQISIPAHPIDINSVIVPKSSLERNGKWRKLIPTFPAFCSGEMTMDIDSRLQAIEEKIHLQDKKLIHQESKLRLRKRLGLISIALLVAFAVFAATRPVAHVIEARKFILKTSRATRWGSGGRTWTGSFTLIGKERGNLGLRYGEDGQGILLTDSSGKTRLTLGIIKDDKTGNYPATNFLEPQGRNRITLATQGRKGQVLLFNDREAGTSSTLGILGGNPTLLYSDKAGKNRVSLQLVDRSNLILSFEDEKSQDRLIMNFPKGEPSFGPTTFRLN